MNLKINQRFDIKYPGFLWVELIDTIKKKKKENKPSGTFKEHSLVMNISRIQFKFLSSKID